MAGYNRTRYVEQLLEKTEYLPPSFTVHLHHEYWVLNNGSRFLYNNQIASLLDDIRAHRIPVDFLELFESARVPFYEGCMVVELLDYRPSRSTEPILKNPDRTRVVLHPSPETLWADICGLNQRNGGRWTDMEALEIEAKLVLATSQPLCLDPDPHLTRVVNSVLRASTPNMPLSLKRKSSAMEPEEDGPEKAKRERLLGFMAPRDNRLHAPSYRLLDAIELNKPKKEAIKTSAALQHGTQYMATNSQSVQPVHTPVQPTPTPQPVPSTPVSAHSPQDHSEPPAQTIDTPQTFNVPFRPNGSHTPVPQTNHQYANQHQPTTLQPSMIQPQVYAAQEPALKRASTPSQPQQGQAYQRPYMQYPYSQQLQQQPHQTSAQSLLPRPPSQPQNLRPVTPASQTLPSPQTSAKQLNSQPVQPSYTQTPKPQHPLPVVQPSQIQQPQPNISASPYQGSVPNPHFLQPGTPSVRPMQRAQGQTGSVQHPQMTLSTNINPSQPQHIYTLNGQPLQPQHSQQLNSQQLYLQRMKQGASTAGGIATPAQQSPRVQPQSALPSRTVSTTPSPTKGSPVVHQQTIGSPLQSKAQNAMQPSGSGQPLPIMTQQSQPTQQTQHANMQQVNHGGMPQRYQFQSQYNHAQLRSHIHGNPPMMVPATGTPTMAHASPILAGRPLTPADGKSQPNQVQQQPIRRPTPIQQPAALTQIPTRLVNQQSPQLQPQQLSSSQQPQVQAQSPHVQQANLAIQQQQLQHQHMSNFAQMYGFQQYWRVPAQQQPQSQGQQNPVATGLSSSQMASMTPQQIAMYRHHMNLLVTQLQQSGQQMTPQQMQILAHNKLMQAAQLQPSIGQQTQVLPQLNQQSQQHQPTNAQLQATMMGKMQLQMGPQHHLQQGHVQGTVGGHAANMSPGQMHMPHFQQPQPQHHSIIQAQQVAQKGKPATAVKKAPAGR